MSKQPTANPNFLTPDFSEFFANRMRDVAASLNCCLIGEILAINTTNQYPTVTVGVNFQKVLKGVLPITGVVGGLADNIVNYPNLVNVPLFIYQGGGAALTMPVTARVTNAQGQITSYGDMCLILFCDRDMDTWYQTGQVAPPNSDRVHNLNDAIAIVGIRNILQAVTNFNPTIASLSDNSGERLTQAGMMSAYAGSSAPSGWLLCQGQAVSRTTYANLFAVIGTTYGAGDGSTTFNIPDMRGQVAAGYNNGDANFGTLGAKIGEATHVLTVPEMPSHSHNVAAYNNVSGTAPGISAGGDGITIEVNQSSAASGGGGAHNNIQPSVTVNWIIKI